MPQHDTAFDLGDHVAILPLEDYPARVTGIWISSKGIQYQVRYFILSKPEEAYFYADEIKRKGAPYGNGGFDR